MVSLSNESSEPSADVVDVAALEDYVIEDKLRRNLLASCS